MKKNHFPAMSGTSTLYGIAILLLLLSSGCRSLNPSIMFTTPKDYPYAVDTMADKVTEYKISEYDQLDMHIYTNDGFKLVDVTAATMGGSSSAGISSGAVHYSIEKDGGVKLPLMGKVVLKGMTLREAETFLEKKYEMYYKNPFVIMDVVNRRVTVFRGEGGSAVVLDIHNDNLTVIEAIARAGGIAQTGKAYKIKLIRGNLHNPEIHLIDLSTIEGAKLGDMTIQANDIIYVEPVRNVDQKILAQLSTIVGILTSALIVVNITRGK